MRTSIPFRCATYWQAMHVWPQMPKHLLGEPKPHKRQSRLHRKLIDQNRSRAGWASRPVRRGPRGALPHPDGKTPSCPAGGGGQISIGLFQPMKLQITEYAKCHRENQLPWYRMQDVTGQHTGGHENNGGGTSADIPGAAEEKLLTAAGCN